MTTTAMGAPPPRSSDPNPNPSPEPVTETLDQQTSTSETTMSIPMGPPPPRISNPDPNTESASETLDEEISTSESTMSIPMGPPSLPPSSLRVEVAEKSSSRPSMEVPYSIPPWSGAPCHHFGFEVLKDGSIIDRFDVYEKGAYMFGRVDLCDFVLDHPTISRFHAVVQYKRSGEAYIYDLGSTHGTFINKKQAEKKTYMDLHVGDVIRFGQSTRLYIFQGPSDLMPPEINLKIKREAKLRESLLDREASLHRARHEASLADGISWGMGEDAIEEAEDDVDEVTWQTYKGQLTERQEKTREKVIKRLEKIAHMKKEIDAIRAKDISQGGLTQGQQTQIARNEQRIAQILEELENLEETLNDSIRESLGARGKLSTGKKKGGIEEEDEYLSDDDDFYDRTKKKPSVKKGAQNQPVETADSLLDKREKITKEIEDKKVLLLEEETQIASEKVEAPETGDALDAFMSDISSQLVIDKSKQLEEELSALQTELDRILYLLKIADPSGEAAKKRVLKEQEEPMPIKSVNPSVCVKRPAPKLPKQNSEPEKPANGLTKYDESSDATTKVDKKSEGSEAESKTVVYIPTKPQWLGAVDNKEKGESQNLAMPLVQDGDNFVDYKDRDKILCNDDGIENAAPGLIIRKRKKIQEPPRGDKNDAQEQSVSSSTSSAERTAMDAVALLLKHQSSHSINEEDSNGDNNQEQPRKDRQVRKDKNKKQKRVIGPEKPLFHDGTSDDETWVPPEGQSGDGRTSLNDRYGY